LKISLFIALLISMALSFYVFITTHITKHGPNKHLYSVWQFPMLLAIFLEYIYLLDNPMYS
jgi:hypothetical protein